MDLLQPLWEAFDRTRLPRPCLGDEIFRPVLRGAAAALIAGLAWKISEDIYEAVKKWIKERRRGPEASAAAGEEAAAAQAED